MACAKLGKPSRQAGCLLHSWQPGYVLKPGAATEQHLMVQAPCSGLHTGTGSRARQQMGRCRAHSHAGTRRCGAGARFCEGYAAVRGGDSEALLAQVCQGGHAAGALQCLQPCCVEGDSKRLAAQVCRDGP